MKKGNLKWIIFLVIAVFLECNAMGQENSKIIRLEYMIVPNGGLMTGTLREGELNYHVADSTWRIHLNIPASAWPGTGKQNYSHAGANKRFVFSADDRSLFCLSPEQYDKIKQTGFVEFEGQYLSVVSTDFPRTYYANGKRLHAIVAESNTGSVRIWILDNPYFPLVLKTEGSPYNADIELISLQ